MKRYKQNRERRTREEYAINEEDKERKYAVVENHIFFIMAREP